MLELEFLKVNFMFDYGVNVERLNSHRPFSKSNRQTSGSNLVAGDAPNLAKLAEPKKTSSRKFS